jgi:hypothetical protein
MYSIILAFLAFIPFHLGKLDKTVQASVQNVRIVEPITIKEN